MLNKLTKMLIKQLATSQFKGVYRKKRRKIFDGRGENETRKKKVRKKKKRCNLSREEMEVTEELNIVWLL